MKTITKAIGAILLAALVSAVAPPLRAQDDKSSGTVIQERTLPPFTGISCGGVTKVVLSTGPVQSVKVESEREYIDKIQTEVEGSVLEISCGKSFKSGKCIVYVTATSLSSIEANGAARITADNNLQSEKLTLTAMGASEMDLKLTVNELTTEVSGAAVVKLAGTATHHSSEVSGAASLKAFDLATDKTNIEVSGAANAKVDAKEELTAETSGASNISTKSEPKIKNIERHGMGKIKIISDSEEKDLENVKNITYTDDEGNTRTITIDEEGVKIVNDSTREEPLIINDEGVKILLRKHESDLKKMTKTLVIDEDGLKVINQEGKLEEVKKKPKFNGHWGGFDLGVNGFLNSDNETSLPRGYDFLDLNYGKSINVGLNLFQQNINLVRNHLGLVTGAGLEYRNYRFDKNIRITGDSALIYGYKDETGALAYKKSKLVVSYLNVPLLLEYQTNSHSDLNSFHIAAGVIGGLRIGSHTKVVFDDEDGKKQKVKERDDFHLNPFKVDATVRIGWGIVNLYGTYSLTTMFKDKKGPELYPFSVGLALTNW